MKVGYISFSFHLFKVKFRETLLSYGIYPFFISMHVHDQSEKLSAISSDENNVNKHTTFCYIRKLFKGSSKTTKRKVMFLTSNKIEYC